MASKVAEARWAYLAGLLDGEGCVTVKTHKRGPYIHYSPSVPIGMCTPALKRLCREYGVGTVSFRPGAKDRWRDAYIWQFDRSDTATVLANTLPFLQVKAEQAKLLLEFLAIHGHKQRGKNADRKNEIVVAIHLLNKKGA